MPTTVATTPIEEIEHALTRIVRMAHLPRLHERLAAASGVDLERTAYPILARVGDEGVIRLTDLSAAMGLDTSTVSRQVQHLTAKGLVERTPDPDDGRASVLSLTRAGRDALARIRAVRRDLLDSVFEGWTQKDQRDLARLLGRLTSAFAGQVEER